MLYGSKAWCNGHNEIRILQRIKGAMVRIICIMNLVNKEITKDLMQQLDFEETVDQLEKVYSVH